MEQIVDFYRKVCLSNSCEYFEMTYDELVTKTNSLLLLVPSVADGQSFTAGANRDYALLMPAAQQSQVRVFVVLQPPANPSSNKQFYNNTPVSRLHVISHEYQRCSFTR